MAEPMRSIRGVVFDLWLTLVPLPSAVRAAAFENVCEALGLSPATLEVAWRQARVSRETMVLLDHLRALGTELSAPWSDETLAVAIAARSASLSTCFEDPFADGREAIVALRAQGIAIALVSNCSSDVRTALDRHGLSDWFDTIVLSAEVGIMKPAPEIYLMAAERLGVDPRECIYVGDGSDDELQGALAAGMTPILYDPFDTAPATMFTTITSHLQLLHLVGAR